MKKRLLYLLLFIVAISLFVSCGNKDTSDINDSGANENNKTIDKEAERLVNKRLLTSYKQMGIEIEEYEISRTKLIEQVPYSEGGEFQFYEIETRLKPAEPKEIKKVQERDDIEFTQDKDGWITENSSMGRIFISAYNDGKKLYEVLWLREMQLPRDEEGKLDFEDFVRYRYEDIIPAKVLEEYTFTNGEDKIAIGENYKGSVPLKDAEVQREETDSFMSEIARYKEIWKTGELCIETYSYFEKHYEPISRMVATSTSVETNRGIKVGSSDEELFKAYGVDKLVFSSNSFGGEWLNSFAQQQNIIEENDEWSCFGFTGEDTSQNYIAFYMKEGKVFAIEMGNGYDYKPFTKEEGKYPLEVEELINDHVDEPNIMKYDVLIPKVKESVNGSKNLNALIQLDFQQIVEFSQEGKYEPTSTGFDYPWVEIKYSISKLDGVDVLNIFMIHSSALGSGSDRFVKSYYYDTSCGARLSEEAGLYKLGYTKEGINKYLKYKHPEFFEEANNQEELLNNVSFYFHETGEPRFLINGLT